MPSVMATISTRSLTMAADLMAEAIGGLARVVVSLLVEVVFELAIRGVGRLLLGVGRPAREPDEAVCVVAGLAFWAVVAALLWAFWAAG
jgi:hypothetical protein